MKRTTIVIAALFIAFSGIALVACRDDTPTPPQTTVVTPAPPNSNIQLVPAPATYTRSM